MASPKLGSLMLSGQERQVLQGWVRRRKTSLALRSRIALACANSGGPVAAVATGLGCRGIRCANGRRGSWRSGWRQHAVDDCSMIADVSSPSESWLAAVLLALAATAYSLKLSCTRANHGYNVCDERCTRSFSACGVRLELSRRLACRVSGQSWL